MLAIDSFPVVAGSHLPVLAHGSQHRMQAVSRTIAHAAMAMPMKKHTVDSITPPPPCAYTIVLSCPFHLP